MNNSPFIRKEKDKFKGQNIQTMFRLAKYGGEVGLEVEVEGNQFPKSEIEFDDEGYPESEGHCHLIPDGWGYTHDGSLRGEDNAEYILSRPTMLDEVPKKIDELWKMFEDYGSVLDESNRTSIHVHLNAQSWHLDRVCCFFGLYFIVEDILTHWCGDHRVGNLFCLRAKDAPGIVARLKRFFATEEGHYLNDGMHYSGLNALALRTLGSIEVRTMRGVKDPETIKTWVSILERIYHLSGQYRDPRDIVQGFSGCSRDAFIHDILGRYADQVMSECGMTQEQIYSSLHEGVRIAQSLCYCRDWSKYQKEDCSPDPFNRSPNDLGPAPEPVPTNPAGEYTHSEAASHHETATLQAFMANYDYLMSGPSSASNTTVDIWNTEPDFD